MTSAQESRREAHEDSKTRVTKDVDIIVDTILIHARPLTAFEVSELTGLHLLRVRPCLSRLSRPDECLAYFKIESPIQESGRKKCIQSRFAVTAYCARVKGVK